MIHTTLKALLITASFLTVYNSNASECRKTLSDDGGFAHAEILETARLNKEGFQIFSDIQATLNEGQKQELFNYVSQLAPSGSIHVSKEGNAFHYFFENSGGRRQIEGPILDHLSNYILEAEARIKAELPEENFRLSLGSLRWNIKGASRPANQTMRPHVDGWYLTVVQRLIGDGTLLNVLPGGNTLTSTPLDVTSVITGQQRALRMKVPGTWHHAPAGNDSRLFLQLMFNP